MPSTYKSDQMVLFDRKRGYQRSHRQAAAHMNKRCSRIIVLSCKTNVQSLLLMIPQATLTSLFSTNLFLFVRTL